LVTMGAHSTSPGDPAWTECRFTEHLQGRQAEAVRLVSHPWESHKLVTSLVGILLTQALNYPVELVTFPTGNATISALAGRGADVDVEAWPDSQARAYEGAVYAEKSVVELGNIGYLGRSGLYVTSATLIGGDCATHKTLQDPATAALLPTDEDGDSEYKPYVSKNAPCSDLASDGSLCPKLFHAYPSYDRGVVEALVEGLGLNVSVVYLADAFEQRLVQRAREDEPMLTYLWRPSLLASRFGSGALRRVTLPEVGRKCVARDKESGERTCDFPFQTLRIIAGAGFERQSPSAAALLRAISLSDEDIAVMMGALLRPEATPERVACDWLEQNRPRVDTWLAAGTRGSGGLATTTIVVAIIVGVVCLFILCVAAVFKRAARSKRFELFGLPRPVRLAYAKVRSAYDRAVGRAPQPPPRLQHTDSTPSDMGGDGSSDAFTLDVPSSTAAGNRSAPPAVQRAHSTGSVSSNAGAAEALSAVEGYEAETERARVLRQLAKRVGVPAGLVALTIGTAIAFYSQVEGWSPLNCAYFAIVLLTTVGYGDVTPQSQGARGFTIVFALLGMAVLGVALLSFVAAVIDAQAEARKRFIYVSLRSLRSLRPRKMPKIPDRLRHPHLPHLPQIQLPAQIRRMSLATPRPPDSATAGAPAATALGAERPHTHHAPHLTVHPAELTNFEYAMTVLRMSQPVILCLVLGTLLGTGVEGWQGVDALYFAVITVTTIGFGDMSPQTDLGRALACVYLPLSVFSVAKSIQEIGQFASMQWTLAKSQDIRKVLAKSRAKELTEAEFTLNIVTQLYGVDAAALAAIKQQFHKLDRDGNGTVNLADCYFSDFVPPPSAQVSRQGSAANNLSESGNAADAEPPGGDA